MESSANIVDGLVSTIIPVHNRPELVRRAVGSVLAQTYRPIEVIVVDDGSTDDTPRVLDRLAADHPDIIRVIHKANGGPGLARETGRHVARGEFVQYLDSDDILLPRKFELQVGALREHPECGVAYGPTGTLTEEGRTDLTPRKRTGEAIDAMFPSFMADRWWDTSTPLYRRALVEAAGPWTELRAEEDWEYDCRIASLGVRLAFVVDPVSVTAIGAAGSLCQQSMAPSALRDRVRARQLIAEHALRAGLTEDMADVQHFGNAAFLLARQCGAVGQTAESAALMALVRRLCPRTVAHSRKFRLYALLGRALGWGPAGRLAVWRDQHR